jgi:hypothetical protein
MLQKGKWLRCEFQLPYQPRLPFAYDFRVENHGGEASLAENDGNHHCRKEITRNGDLGCVHWESTKYRGLHYLNVSVTAQGTQVLSSRLGIWIE